MAEHFSEHQIIEQARSGDSQALQRLLHLYWRRVEGYVKGRLPRTLQGVIEPRDILQDVYQLAFRGIRNFQPQGEDAVFRWFITIARNRMAEMVRARSAAKRGGAIFKDTQGATDESVIGLLEQLAVSHRTPSLSAIRHELAEVLQASLDQLPAQYQEAVRFRYFDGLSIEQIAAKMNRSKGSAQMLLNRGLKQLKKSLLSASRYS